MADINERPEYAEEPTAPTVSANPRDPRKPYEAPRLLKKRSVARATLFSVMSTMASGLTVMG